MPTYQYQCSSCGDLEFYQSIYEATFTTCPRCESENFRKIIATAPGIKFNGSGFYSVDSRGK